MSVSQKTFFHLCSHRSTNLPCQVYFTAPSLRRASGTTTARQSGPMRERISVLIWSAHT